MVNTRVPKNNTFRCDYPITTFGVAFYHPSGLTVGILAIEDDSLTSEAIEGILGMEEGGLALMLP